MKQQDIIQLIKNPQALGMAQLQELQGFASEFPFFQTAQLLYTIGVKEHQPQHYQKQLRKTAIIANNRTVLYELLHAPSAKPTVAVPEVKEPEKQPEQEVQMNKVSNVTVTSDEVKVIYITTPAAIEKQVIENEKRAPENKAQQELEVLKEIDNDTVSVEEPATDHTPAFNEEKLNKEIELEISRQLVDSYVQTEIIRTPELHDDIQPQTEPGQEEIKLEAEPGSFMDWLQKVKKGDKTEEKQPENTKIEEKEAEKPQKSTENSKFEEKRKLIDKIIESDPGKIRMSRDKFFSATQDAKQSLLENEHLITETLAKIYALQGNISKAIRAYEILSLKFPQKSAYFASLIEKLKTK